MRVLLLLLLLTPVLARAEAPAIIAALRSNDWPTATSLAAAEADPVARKLVTFYRLQQPGEASAGEIAAFLSDNPDWPDREALLAARDAALANEPDDAAADRLCHATAVLAAPTSGPALTRCAAAATALGHGDDAAADARSAFVAGFPDPEAETEFLSTWGKVLTAADYRARFRRLIGVDTDGAAALLPRLPAGDVPLARALVAVDRGAPDAPALVAALPAAQQADPDLVRSEIRKLLRADQDDAALALWRTHGVAAETAGGAPMAAAFWSLRNQMARTRLQAGDGAGAFALADGGLPLSGEAGLDKAFLAGFIALRSLHQPEVAAARFRLLEQSGSAITEARAHYWLARAAEAAGDGAAARSEYAAAAAWPTTFYGQLAALAGGADGAALNANIGALADPSGSSDEAVDFAGRELTRAAALLVAWGDPHRARPFLLRVAALASDAPDFAMAAHLALGLDVPEASVMAARFAGRAGTMLPAAGWPVAFDPPSGALPAPVVLGIIRQESSFDAGAVSHSGALGLMQLLPGTARQVGREMNDPVQAASLTTDPAANMRLGSAYLADLVAKFGGSLPLAIAAYNAGPNRVEIWLAENGDPRGQGEAAMIDWIERIPYAETRNYVQRVIENIAMYRAKLHQVLPYPVGS